MNWQRDLTGITGKAMTIAVEPMEPITILEVVFFLLLIVAITMLEFNAEHGEFIRYFKKEVKSGIPF